MVPVPFVLLLGVGVLGLAVRVVARAEYALEVGLGLVVAALELVYRHRGRHAVLLHADALIVLVLLLVMGVVRARLRR